MSVVKSKYEAQLWQEIQGLKEPELLKIIKLVHFFKEELLEKKTPRERPNKIDIMKYAGLLKGLSLEEERIFDEAATRRSLFGERRIAL